MGCDIHLVLERKIDNEWVGLHAFQTFSGNAYDGGRSVNFDWFSAIARNRNYSLFTELANVRGDGGIDPKGLPDDASPLARHMLGDDPDIHSQTWWMLEDALGVFAGHCIPESILSEDRRDKAMRLFGLWNGESDVKDFRLCIGFDN